MNILFINNIPFNPILGGIERVTDILSKELILKGYNIFYLSGYPQNKSLLNYDYPATTYTFPDRDLFNSEKNINYYKEIINKHNIKIVINQRGLEATFNNALEINNVIKISVLHSRPKAYLNLHIGNILTKPKTFKEYIKFILKGSLYGFIYYYKRNKAIEKLSIQYSHLINKSDKIILLSQKYIEEFLSCKITCEENKIIGIPNPNTFHIQDINWEKKEKTILYVGRLETYNKNPQRLIYIWKKIHINNPDWKIVFVGGGTAEKKMKEYVQRNNIQRVFFEGMQENVSKYYRKASLICLTSNFEGWPMALTEGMAFGCIPFTYNSFKAASDIIDDGINGYLIKPFSINQYSKKIQHLISDNSKLKQMSQQAIIKVNKFNAIKIAEQWDTLLKKLYTEKNIYNG